MVTCLVRKQRSAVRKHINLHIIVIKVRLGWLELFFWRRSASVSLITLLTEHTFARLATLSRLTRVFLGVIGSDSAKCLGGGIHS